jgi:hypothetical protein
VFVPGNPFQPSLMSVVKAMTLESGIVWPVILAKIVHISINLESGKGSSYQNDP